MDVSTSATHSRSILRHAVFAATLTAITFELTACGSGSSSAAQPSSGGPPYQRLVSAYVAYARCARSHGMPNLPDPQVDDQGNDHYPSLDLQGKWSWPQSVIHGCASVWDRVHAIRDQFDSQRGQGRAPSLTSRAQALAFARCIRAHGFPNFPDPNTNGSTYVDTLPPGFTKPNLSPQARAAINACSRPRSS
jgi:hypothetical protein